MSNFKIKYWDNENICVCETSAETAELARYWFEMIVPHTDIISIEETGAAV